MLGISSWAGLQFGVAVYQLGAPYSTTYDYRQTGMEAAAAFLADLPDNELFSSMKDLEHPRTALFDDYGAVNAGRPLRKPSSMPLRQVESSWKYSQTASDRILLPTIRLGAWVEAHCKVVKSFGNYRIYQLDSP